MQKQKKDNRPSYIKAAKSESAILLYKKFIVFLEEIIQKKVMSGKFGGNMKIKSVNDGPVTILIDTKNKKN